jgi:hypothetical protein
MDAGHPACVFTLRCQRHEARLGLCMAFADGGRDIRHHSHRVRPRSSAKVRRELSAMDQVIGVMVVIVVIGLIADKILFSPWERFLHRRWGTGLE